MPAPLFSASDYLRAFQAFMPRGRAWPDDPESIMARTLSGYCPAMERINTRSNALIDDAFPSTSHELLPEWEDSLGLPDTCIGEEATIQKRRSQVVAKLTGTGGQSKAYFIGYAAALGYTVTVEEYSPFRMGQHRMGKPLGDEGWAHTWAVVAPQTTIVSFVMGKSSTGEPLQAWGNAALQCSLEKIAPAHTELLFIYQ